MRENFYFFLDREYKNPYTLYIETTTQQENIMSTYRTVILEIAGTNFSRSVMYKTALELDTEARFFIASVGLDGEDDIQVNVYDPEYSLEYCVNKLFFN